MVQEVRRTATSASGNRYLEPGSRSAELYERARAVMPGGNTRGTYNSNPVTMIAGHSAMTMLTPQAFDRLSALGQRLRTGLATVFETRGASWQVTGQGSLFKLHPHPRPLVDYRSALPRPAEQAAAEQFYLAMLGSGIVLTPDLAGALSTPMAESHVDELVETADRVFGQLETRSQS